MKKEENLISQFDHLNSIEPTAEWNEQLLRRLNQAGQKSKRLSGNRLALLAIILLFAINVYSLSKSWLNERSQENSNGLRSIANEYLISTNSSKF